MWRWQPQLQMRGHSIRLARTCVCNWAETQTGRRPLPAYKIQQGRAIINAGGVVEGTPYVSLVWVQAGFGHDFRSLHQGGATTCSAPAPPGHLLRVLPRCFTEVSATQPAWTYSMLQVAHFDMLQPTGTDFTPLSDVLFWPASCSA
jgi:hypothetical protein